ncbi:hypothetical protein RB195_019015 [Necator americanus]|uniref:Uncharacterized protein n=1 Tax=Necator americanus TaxID=51031 RepID=A0ABR1CDT8_NECAM
MMYASETWAAASTVMERLDCTERRMLRRLLGHFWSGVCHNVDLYAEIDVETGRSPCSTSSEEFVGFELEEATWPKRKFWTEVVKEDLRTLGVDRHEGFAEYGIATKGLILCKLSLKIEKQLMHPHTKRQLCVTSCKSMEVLRSHK